MAKRAALNARSAAALILVQVLREKQSLNTALPAYLPDIAPEQRGLCQQLCYGVLRYYPSLQAISEQLLQKTLKRKDQDIHALLLAGLYQLRELRIPDHAVLSETVNAVSYFRKDWAKGILNACLRNYQRQAETLEQALLQIEATQYAHPQWLIDLYRQEWPEHWQAIVAANNAQAPMFLRVNLQQVSRETYLESLAEQAIAAAPVAAGPAAIQLEHALDVQALPGFNEGWVSVQDGAAQKVADLLQLTPGLHILDACAAPGGKTCHILETQPDSRVLALDIDPARLERVRHSLQRLNCQAELRVADAARTDTWWQGEAFDRILIDAPCTGSGVIRRHPDIKVLRQPEDIASLALRQQSLLDALWPLLKPDGILVYTTCSIFKAENEQQIAAFLDRHADAAEWLPETPPTRKVSHGFQHLPGDDAFDGFYYACLRRHA